MVPEAGAKLLTVPLESAASTTESPVLKTAVVTLPTVAAVKTTVKLAVLALSLPVVSRCLAHTV